MYCILLRSKKVMLICLFYLIVVFKILFIIENFFFIGYYEIDKKSVKY